MGMGISGWYLWVVSLGGSMQRANMCCAPSHTAAAESGTGILGHACSVPNPPVHRQVGVRQVIEPSGQKKHVVNGLPCKGLKGGSLRDLCGRCQMLSELGGTQPTQMLCQHYISTAVHVPHPRYMIPCDPSQATTIFLCSGWQMCGKLDAMPPTQ